MSHHTLMVHLHVVISKAYYTFILPGQLLILAKTIEYRNYNEQARANIYEPQFFIV